MNSQGRKISVVGWGYVDLPAVLEFGKSQQVIGFDINSIRMDELKQGIIQYTRVRGAL